MSKEAKTLAVGEAVREQSIWRVATAAFVGTLVEWYDYYIYGTAAALIFSGQFFPDVDPTTALIASFATFGVGFLARPLGGLFAGHYGDRIGRKSMLIFTLSLMGVSTVLIGLLPSYAQIGIWAPILLVVLRLAQGFGVGGEWGGAAVMVVEYAPVKRRGFFGGLPQAGNVGGLVLATGIFAIVSLLPDEDLHAWGWRIPFLFSAVLILVGLYIRSKVQETPSFRTAENDNATHKLPMAAAFRDYKREILLAIGAAATVFSGSYLAITYVVSYATHSVGMKSSTVLTGITIAASVAFFCWPASGWLSDKVGRRPMMLSGAVLILALAFPFFWLVNTGSTGLTWIAIVALYGVAVGLIAGVLPSFFSELFDTRVRYTGVSIAYQAPAVLVGGFTPMIATWLVAQAGGQTWSVSLYISAIAAASFICLLMVKETRGVDMDRVDVIRS
ncbi:MAG: Permease of the major facilitator superfamily [Mycobacterium sp.]|jgi:metabolite-proton symporter|nr:Permease of the major facilitator superfamily [Mycobacterium sp.]MDT5311737.1 transporter, family, shikimate and dehydroshikimate transport protein [Mycobacterium sp.]